MISDSENGKKKKYYHVKIKRDGVVKAIKGIVSLPFEDKQTLTATDANKTNLRQAWLKN
jgi:hypothetical protein